MRRLSFETQHKGDSDAANIADRPKANSVVRLLYVTVMEVQAGASHQNDYVEQKVDRVHRNIRRQVPSRRGGGIFYCLFANVGSPGGSGWPHARHRRCDRKISTGVMGGVFATRSRPKKGMELSHYLVVDDISARGCGHISARSPSSSDSEWNLKPGKCRGRTRKMTAATPRTRSLSPAVL